MIRYRPRGRPEWATGAAVLEFLKNTHGYSHDEGWDVLWQAVDDGCVLMRVWSRDGWIYHDPKHPELTVDRQAIGSLYHAGIEFDMRAVREINSSEAAVDNPATMNLRVPSEEATQILTSLAPSEPRDSRDRRPRGPPSRREEILEVVTAVRQRGPFSTKKALYEAAIKHAFPDGKAPRGWNYKSFCRTVSDEWLKSQNLKISNSEMRT